MTNQHLHMILSLLPWVILLVTMLVLEWALDPHETGGDLTNWTMCVGTSVVCVALLLWQPKQVPASHDGPPTAAVPKDVDKDNTMNYNIKDVEQGPDKPVVSTNANRAFLPEQSKPQGENQQRLYFLDNLKVFLTFLVVCHHVNCAFGTSRDYPLVVGQGRPTSDMFSGVLRVWNVLNEGFFMPLFFFVSAYFTPASLARKGLLVFWQDKSRRLWMPAIFVTLFLYPMLVRYAQEFAQNENEGYAPDAGQTWFLYWLLVLNLVYGHVMSGYVPQHEKTLEANEETHNADQVDRVDEQDGNNDASCWLRFVHRLFSLQTIPHPVVRWTVGAVVGGLAQWGVRQLVDSQSFGAMPTGRSGLTCNILLFGCGILAKHFDWFGTNRPLRTQIGMNIWLLRFAVVVEAFLLNYIFIFADTKTDASFMGGYVVSGVYCIDMSLVMLDFFQQNLDFQVGPLRFLSQAAYGVYVFHPFFVIMLTSLFVHVYEKSQDEELVFYEVDGDMVSWTPIDTKWLGVGWMLVLVACHLMVWPFAWTIRRLPGLRRVL